MSSSEKFYRVLYHSERDSRVLLHSMNSIKWEIVQGVV